MKSVVIHAHGDPEVLTICDRPIPEPGPNEVLIHMAASAVGKPDYLMRTGKYPWTKDILPFYPGLFGTGTVVAIGKNVEGIKLKQKVFVDHPVVCGCYSEYKTAPADLITPLPEETDLISAAVVNNHVIAWSLLKTTCCPAEGKTLYIKSAAGALGTAIVQLAPLLGLNVIASASTHEKCRYLSALGAEHVFCYSEVSEIDAVLEYTNNLGADYILDQCVGSHFTDQFQYLNRGGTVIVYNTLNGFPEENMVQFLTDNFAQCWSIRAFSFHLHDGRTEEIQALRSEIFQLLADGRLKPQIGRIFDLNEIVEAHRTLDAGTCLGSIVLRID